MALLKQEYRCGIYYFNREEPQDARLIDEIGFTVEGTDEQALGRAADKKLDEISSGLKDGQYIDDIKWGDPQEAAPEKKVAEYIVYRCPDGSILLDWNETLWKSGYPAYPKHRCTELERGFSEGGMALPKLHAAMKKKYLEEGGHD